MEDHKKFWGNPLASRRISDAISIAVSEACTEDSDRERIKHGKPWQAAKGIFSEYCYNSSVHGIKYLGERHRTPIERLFWIVMFIGSLYFCGRLIWNIYEKWDTSPVIVNFAEKPTPISEIPFPAVTICPETKAKQTVFNFTEVFHRIMDNETLTEDQKFKLEVIAQTCDAHLLVNHGVGQEFTTTECIQQLMEMSPQFNETLYYCKYQNEYCDTLFSPMITEDGVCYTFNALNGREIYRHSTMADDFIYYEPEQNDMDAWTLESGYTSEKFSVYPRRVTKTGDRAGLFVLLSLYEKEMDYLCRGPIQRFKVFLHTPNEPPRLSNKFFWVPILQEVTVTVKPKMMQTSDRLRNYSPERRQCYFNHDRQLKYFQIYTQSNCELECLANHTLNECGCVKFSMPRDNETRICGAAQIECYNEAENILLLEEITSGNTKCNCLPACTSIQYDFEMSQFPFNWEDLFKAFKNPIDEFPGMQFSRLVIFFKDTKFISSKRFELYGPTDFVASFGGLMGLFMGISLLSFVEIFYFCSVRLCCNLKMRMDNKKKEEKALPPPPGIMIEKPLESKD